MAYRTARTPEAIEARRLYNTARWKTLRKWILGNEPLCRTCRSIGIIAPASIVDHIKPHKGDIERFFGASNLQPLCKPCHDSTKQSYERLGYSTQLGADGWPEDPKHPTNLSQKVS